MESTSNYAHQVERHWSDSLMGPYSEQKQLERAGAIKRLLDNNPNMDSVTRSMWERKANALAISEEEYNARVKAIYSKMKRGVIEYE